MSRNIIILISLIVLLGLGYFGNQQGWFSSKTALRDFAIKDTSGINKIYLVEKNGKDLLLENISGTWMVNKQFPANAAYLDQIFETLQKLQVKNPISSKDMSGIINLVASSHTKVEVFKNNQIYKTYYISTSNPTHDGTYILLDGSSEPFVCEVPGFEGSVTPQFHTDVNKWKSKVLFKIKPEELEKIEFQYSNPSESFTIEYNNNGFIISPKIEGSIDSGLVSFIRGFFQGKKGDGIYAESYGTITPFENLDSIFHSQPFLILNIYHHHIKDVFSIHRKNVDPRTKAQYDPVRKQFEKYDTEHYYAFKNNKKEAILIQDYVFGNLFRKRIDLFK